MQVVLTPDSHAAIGGGRPRARAGRTPAALDALTDGQLAQLGEISRTVITQLTTDGEDLTSAPALVELREIEP